MRWVQNFLGNYGRVPELAFETLRIYEELGDEEMVAKANTFLGEALYPLEKYDEAIRHLMIGYQIQKKRNLLNDLAYTRLRAVVHTPSAVLPVST